MASETKRAINIPAMSVTSEIAFLRALAAADRTLGIVSHHAPGDDSRSDGLRFESRDELAWQRLDGQLCAGLSCCRSAVSQHESAPIWSKAGPYIGVIRVGSAMFAPRPLCPEQLP